MERLSSQLILREQNVKVVKSFMNAREDVAQFACLASGGFLRFAVKPYRAVEASDYRNDPQRLKLFSREHGQDSRSKCTLLQI